MKKLILVLLVIAATCNSVFAQAPAVVVSDKAGWHKIGETTVSFKVDRDQISILGADRFKEIKFKITDAPIHLWDVEVYYESGDKQEVQIRSEIKEGGESRVIDLDGKDRNLKKIAFVYKTIPNAGKDKGHVEIWGLK